jgi:hypothetical protein
MLDEQDATNVDAKGIPFTVRTVFVIDPQKKIRLTLAYPVRFSTRGKAVYLKEPSLTHHRGYPTFRPRPAVSLTRSSVSSTRSRSVTRTRSPLPPTGPRDKRSLSTLRSRPRRPRSSSPTVSRSPRYGPASCVPVVRLVVDNNVFAITALPPFHYPLNVTSFGAVSVVLTSVLFCFFVSSLSPPPPLCIKFR